MSSESDVSAGVGSQLPRAGGSSGGGTGGASGLGGGGGGRDAFADLSDDDSDRAPASPGPADEEEAADPDMVRNKKRKDTASGDRRGKHVGQRRVDVLESNMSEDDLEHDTRKRDEGSRYHERDRPVSIQKKKYSGSGKASKGDDRIARTVDDASDGDEGDDDDDDDDDIAAADYDEDRRSDLRGVEDADIMDSRNRSRGSKEGYGTDSDADLGGGGDDDDDEDNEDDLDDGGRRAARAAPRHVLPRGPAHHRTVVMQPRADGPVTLLKMPPTIDVPLAPCDPAKDELPVGAGLPLMYRLKPRVTRADVERAVDTYGLARALPLIAESNARLVTWSDGSRTLMIGDEHFAVAADRIAPTSLYIFRKGTDMQSYHGKVGDIFSVQPSTVNRKRRDSLMALGLGPGVGAGGRAGGIVGGGGIGPGVKAVRTMGRMYDGGAEKEEKEAVASFQSKQREAARLQSKRRRLAERQVRPERRMTKADLESDDGDHLGDDDDDDYNHVKGRETIREDRRREMEREARLRELQRGPAKVPDRVAAPQRRKIGARRVLGMDDDDDDDDDIG
jgi:hypothetical protein